MGEVTRVPASCRWLLRIGAWLAPRARRPEWRERWERPAREWWAFLQERGQTDAAARDKVLRHCRTACADALRQRFPREPWAARWHRLLPGPAFCLALIASAVAALAVFTGGLPATRAALLPLPYADPGRVYVITWIVPFLGRPIGVTPEEARLWRRENKSLQNLATYAFRDAWIVAPDSRPRAVVEARVPSDFFSLLNVAARLGRTFRPGDAGAQAVLSDRLWRSHFGADASLVGKDVVLDGRPVRVVGVLPRSFWFLTHRAGVWTLTGAEPPAGLVGAVGRVRAGASAAGVAAQLQALSQKADPATSHQVLELTPAAEANRSLVLYQAVLLLSLAAGVAAALFHGPLAAWRYWLFFLWKTLALEAALALASIEWTTARELTPSGFSDAVAGYIFAWIYLLGCCGAFWISWSDQKRRCPVCLRRLALPVTIGSWSSPLLDPVSTELICEQGHGALYVAGTRSSGAEPDKWTALDQSWRDLFTSKK